ncbi:hypothetical protein [Devosia sp. RR2S18]|uniref:hypothetical protein n=1 Tax=Devosia rhizosphaerae TaxID=3049774 RepID=UPI002541379A|nr:hypothetical protein [Devosia sp. RR2S18]WIJ26580.1 hypothetical protein QOV41_07470 [Devosia sp. RR2S18]
MDHNLRKKFNQRKWTPPPETVGTLPSAQENSEHLFIDIGSATLLAGVPIAAFYLMLVV